MIRAKNEKDLLNILRLISSEAVGLSKKRINENIDPAHRRYEMQYTEDEARYGKLSEEESEEDEDPPAEEKSAKEEPAEETGEVGASFDSVVQAVNNLRAGKSLRDSSIKQQAQNYYDKLSDAERTTLLVFLKALSDIIAGQVDGKDAQDPSQPPVSINMTSGDEPEEDIQEPAEPAEPVGREQEQQQASEEEEEDTAPPIKVNESQDLTMLRKKFRRMMLRG